MEKIQSNRAKCRKCGDVVESKNVHDYRSCTCGAIAVDGGTDYLKRTGNPEDIEELSRTQTIPELVRMSRQELLQRIKSCYIH
jgi:uncharacterized protein (DUF1330 family)